MVIVNKNAAIREIATVPVICDSCGVERELENTDEQLCYALISSSEIFEFEQELALLNRTQSLFDRFPSSLHPRKLAKEYLHKGERSKSQPDAEFDKALDEDPELKEWLINSGFWLPARLNFVRGALEQWKQKLNRDIILCTSCHAGYYHIEPTFFERLI